LTFTGFSGQHIVTETSVNNYQSRQRNNPEGRKSHLHRSENLKSLIIMPTGVCVPIGTVQNRITPRTLQYSATPLDNLKRRADFPFGMEIEGDLF